ncbi:MAG: helix-turn-helix domain-containing protein [Thermoplasmata archaeon]
MSNRYVSSVVEEIPKEIRVAFTKGVSDDSRLAILLALNANGKHSFKELKERFKMNESTLNYHLNRLLESGLITNYYTKSSNIKTYSFYEMSAFGKVVLNRITSILDEIPTPISLASESKSASGSEVASKAIANSGKTRSVPPSRRRG